MPDEPKTTRVNDIGLRGELIVAEKLISLGWSVATPMGSHTYYDLLIHKDSYLKKVQVKSTESLTRTVGSNAPSFQFSCRHGKTHRNYSKDEVDFFIFCALDCAKFWVLPINSVKTTHVKIYTGPKCKYSNYENAWTLLEA
jgi:hypothetical protein